MMRALLLLCSVVFSFLASAAFSAAVQERPFRLGMFRINQAFDAAKPLAVDDSAGYIIKGDLIIGGFNRKFVTGWNYKLKKRVWWSEVDGEPTSPLLLVENTIFFSTRSGKLYSINSVTGQQNWEVALDSHSERPLVIADGKIYAVTAGQVAYAIDAPSGKRLWVFDAGFPDHLIVKRPPAPVVSDGRLIFGVSSGELVAVKIDDGKLAWRYNPLYVDQRFHDLVGEMSIAGGKLILTRYDGLVAQIDMGSDRKVLWQNSGTSISTSTFRSGRVYTGHVAGDVWAYDSQTGRTIWRTQIGGTPSYIIAGETKIFAIGADGRIVAIDAATGEIAWGEDLGGRIAAPPIVTEDRMYISTGLRNIYGYKL